MLVGQRPSKESNKSTLPRAVRETVSVSTLCACTPPRRNLPTSSRTSPSTRAQPLLCNGRLQSRRAFRIKKLPQNSSQSLEQSIECTRGHTYKHTREFPSAAVLPASACQHQRGGVAQRGATYGPRVQPNWPTKKQSRATEKAASREYETAKCHPPSRD